MWKEEKIKHTAEHIGVISIGALTTLVNEIRKKDKEELIKKIPAFDVIIKDYYQNN